MFSKIFDKGDINNMATLISLVFSIAVIVGMWKMFVKAGEDGWKCIIPIYNFYIMFQIAKAEGFGKMMLSMFGGIIVGAIGAGVGIASGSSVLALITSLLTIVLEIYAMVIQYKMYVKLSEAFGYPKTFALGLFFVSPIFICIIGFSDCEYLPNKQGNATTEFVDTNDDE
jgi:hypothetical protein